MDKRGSLALIRRQIRWTLACMWMAVKVAIDRYPTQAHFDADMDRLFERHGIPRS